ncbi:MAG: polymerase ECF-type sigma factor [Solirubrobacterales bacterium]|nr:polymerase ECF-type sigma factor [Solirubrobacterales bacterium]
MRQINDVAAQSDHSQFAGSGDSDLVRKAVARAKENDPEALHFLYVRYSPDVLRYVRKLVQDDYEAEDITQNVFMKLMSVICKYEPREVPFAAWILRVARNVALDYLRARRATPSDEIRVRDDEHGRISHERGQDLRQALEGLPDEQRDVLVLRHIVGLSPVEIASVLGKTESSVHGLHHRGRLSLKASLQQLGATPVVAP